MIEGLLLAPLVVPHFTVGLGMLILAAQIGAAAHLFAGDRLPRHPGAAVRAAHRSISRCAISISGSSLPPRASARSPAACCATVTLPLLMPGLVSGWLFAAILSFNEFTASLFVTAQRTQTLPVAMYNYVREYADPTMAAMSVIFIVVTATLLALANSFLGLGKVLNVEQAR